MKGLTARDREVLGLYAARMSTASIAAMCGGTEAAIYNRLTRLAVTSVGQALELLRADDQARKATAERYAPKPPVAEAPVQVTPAPSPALTEASTHPVITDPGLTAARPCLDRLSPSAVTAPPSPAPAASPTASRQPAYSKGGLRLKPVSHRIARWAGHFLRARWSLQEVADLFDVAEDDLAQACAVLA